MGSELWKPICRKELIRLYCETQECSPRDLEYMLERQILHYDLDGWMLLKCNRMDSNPLSDRAILPYGPNNLHRYPQRYPKTLYGICSDMSVVIAICRREWV